MKKRKKIAGLFTCMILSLSLWGSTLTALAYVNTVGVVGDGGARIRAAASTDSTVMASVTSGDRVEICGTEVGSDGYTWYKVYVDGNTVGYIRKDLVTDTGEETGGIAPDNLTGTQVTTQTETEPEPETPDITEEEQPETGTETTPEGESTEQTPVVQEPAASTGDASLYAISISSGLLTPDFSPQITEYTLDVSESTTAISVFGVPAAEGALVTENYGFSNLVSGSNMAVITVAAPDGTTKSYYFTVNRGEASTEIHYQTPQGVSNTESSDTTANTVQEQSTGSSHTVLIVLLVIALLVMGVLLVLMGIRIRDYRRELYGEDPDEFHLRDAIPVNSVFNSRTDIRRASRPARKVTYQEPEEDIAGETSDEPDIQVPVNTAGAMDGRDSFLYQVRSAVQEQLGGATYQAPEGGYDEDAEEDLEARILPEDDELEDITERDATITDHHTPKDVWKPANFMTPADDLEFEFLDLEDKE